MDCKIKVLHVVHWPKSGIVSFLYNFLKASKSDHIEYHMVFFIADDEPDDDLERVCKSVHYLDYENHKVRSIVDFKKIINEINPDVIHTHSYQPGIWARLFSIFRHSILVSTIHSPYPYFLGGKLKERVKKVTETITINLFNSIVICDSDAIRKHLMSYTGIHHDKLTVIKIGIDIKEKRYDSKKLREIKEKLGINNEFVIISVGRLSEEKGYDNLLRAFALLSEDVTNCSLIIIGQGNLMKSLKELSRNLGIKDKTHLLGFVDDIFPFLAVSSVYVCSSRYEGLPVSILEAMMMKLPVVATRVGGIPEIIEDSVTGLLVEPDEPDLLKEAILDILTNEKKQKEMIEESCILLQSKFNIQFTVVKVESIYLDMLDMLQKTDKKRDEKNH